MACCGVVARMACRVFAAILLAFCHAAHSLRTAEGVGPTLDFVVAAETKHLGWMDNILKAMPAGRLRLYCRGEANSDPRCLSRERRGSPESMMLRHIVDNYNSLADVTVFLHDRISDLSLVELVLGSVASPAVRANFSGFYAGRYQRVEINDDRPQDSCRVSAKTFGLWYPFYVNGRDKQLARVKCTGAPTDSIFAVSAKRLRWVHRAAYVELLSEVSRCDGTAGNLPARFLSWSWAAMYSVECHEHQHQEAAAELRQLGAPQSRLRQGLTRDPSIDLVVASYKAPLGWVDEVQQQIPEARLHLYCKNDANRDPRCIHMENVGTEEWAYLHHILSNWDNLADITIFSIDNMESMADYVPTTRECLDFVVSKVDSPEKRANFQGYEALDFMPVTQKFNIEYYFSSALKGDDLEYKKLCPASASPFGPWYLKFINASDTTFSRMNCAGSSMHGTFAVSREQIHRVPKSVLEGLVKEVERCRGVNHFVAGHYMERSWSILFSKHCRTEEAFLNLHRRNSRKAPVKAPLPPSPR